MKYIDLCSGISAPTVAWGSLGWQAAAYAETASFPSAVLKHHYPNVENVGDFTKIGGIDYAADLAVAGTPCQDFSVAGLRAGLDGSRGQLTIEFARFLERAQPRWFLWENVPGILSADGGRAFGFLLWLLGKCGYGFAYRILDAQYAGVPQRRRRIFLVGHLGDWRRAAAVLFDDESMQGYPAPRREAGQKTAPTLAARTKGGGGLGTDCDCDGGLIAGSYWDGGDTADTLDASNASKQQMMPEKRRFQAVIAAALTGNPYGDHESRESLLVAHSLPADGFYASEDGMGRGTPLVPIQFDPIQCTSPTYGGQPKGLDDACHSLHTSGPAAVALNFRGRDDGAVRRLTPRECERLQGFPDDYTLVPYRRKLAADGPRYKALGNSMAVPELRWLGERIAMVDKLEVLA